MQNQIQPLKKGGAIANFARGYLSTILEYDVGAEWNLCYDLQTFFFHQFKLMLNPSTIVSGATNLYT